jgi:hypothetical protein
MLISIDINNMKKFYFIPVFILTGVILQFSSCNEKLYTVKIENNSKRLVSYEYNGERDDLGKEAGVDNSKKYTVGPYTHPPKDINVIREDGGEFNNETMTIRMEKYKENIYTFVDSEPLILSVLNKLPIEVVLRADKYIYCEYIIKEDKIDEDPIFENSTEMRIPAFDLKKNEEEQLVKGKIYTATPNFTLFPSQYTVDWHFNDERTAINVTIR